MDYSFHISKNTVDIKENGIYLNIPGLPTTLRDTDMYQIIYDENDDENDDTNNNIIYYKNGVELRRVATSKKKFGISMRFEGYVTSYLKLTDYIAFNRFIN